MKIAASQCNRGQVSWHLLETHWSLQAPKVCPGCRHPEWTYKDTQFSNFRLKPTAIVKNTTRSAGNVPQSWHYVTTMWHLDFGRACLTLFDISVVFSPRSTGSPQLEPWNPGPVGTLWAALSRSWEICAKKSYRCRASFAYSSGWPSMVPSSDYEALEWNNYKDDERFFVNYTEYD